MFDLHRPRVTGQLFQKVYEVILDDDHSRIPRRSVFELGELPWNFLFRQRPVG